MIGVGETPLNGNGTHPFQDEDIVCSQMKFCGVKTQQGVANPIKLFSKIE